MRFHRAELQKALMVKVGDIVQLNRRLSTYTEYANHVELEFSDGSFVNCDVLIAADGIKSGVRKQFLKEIRKGMAAPTADPVWSGTLAYRGLLSHDAIEKQFPNHRAKSRAVIVSALRSTLQPVFDSFPSIVESTRLACWACYSSSRLTCQNSTSWYTPFRTVATPMSSLSPPIPTPKASNGKVSCQHTLPRKR